MEQNQTVYNLLSSDKHTFTLNAEVAQQSEVLETMFASSMQEGRTKGAKLDYEKSTLEPLITLMHEQHNLTTNTKSPLNHEYAFITNFWCCL